MAKLAEDHFTPTVLGQFKRGKSSLMNAVLGRHLLPVGVRPLTSAITVQKYGPSEKLVVHREGTLSPEEVPISCLGDYVTEKGNPGNEKRVSRARLELPLPFLRRGLEFVDTPGVGSSIEANSTLSVECSGRSVTSSSSKRVSLLAVEQRFSESRLECSSSPLLA